LGKNLCDFSEHVENQEEYDPDEMAIEDVFMRKREKL
jgi:Holliday junction resolvasome RuvABC endonuclease subunit